MKLSKSIVAVLFILNLVFPKMLFAQADSLERVKEISTYRKYPNKFWQKNTIRYLSVRSYFDKLGRKIREEFFEHNGNISATYHYSYDTNNNLIRIIEYDSLGNLVKESIAKAKDGSVIPFKLYEPPELLCGQERVACVHDAKGRLIEKAYLKYNTKNKPLYTDYYEYIYYTKSEVYNPEIISLSIDVPKYGKPMQYRFPEHIEMILNEALSNGESKLNFIRLSEKSDTLELLLYSIDNTTSIDSTSDFAILLASTNRYYKNGDKSVPIFFGFDFRFSFPSFTFTHNALFIRFVAESWYDQANLIHVE